MPPSMEATAEDQSSTAGASVLVSRSRSVAAAHAVRHCSDFQAYVLAIAECVRHTAGVACD